MKARISHLYEIIAGAILSLLGLSGCVNPFDGPVEYGTPNASYKVVGEVKDEADKPIPGIKVTVHEYITTYRNGDTETHDTYLVSDSEGKVTSERLSYYGMDITRSSLTLEDVDGEENGGLFEAMELQVKDLDVTFSEDKNGGWHKGDYTIGFEAKLKVSNPEL
ncbi:MAG: radical SAM-associated putative lipoprotein [Bacteroidales bacterium]|nr:radical SAM-associated putative lipoprotein [Bacteroidales bacterium]